MIENLAVTRSFDRANQLHHWNVWLGGYLVFQTPIESRAYTVRNRLAVSPTPRAELARIRAEFNPARLAA